MADFETEDLLDAVGEHVEAIANKHAEDFKSRIASIEATITELKSVQTPVLQKGEKGDRGEPGQAGERGSDGERGADGSTGDCGIKGEKGEQGESGVNGEKGEAGEKGDKGDSGNPGADGVPGKDGAPGCDGKSVTIDDMIPVLESMHSKWALDFERRAQDLFQRAIDRMPTPKDGADGKNGSDGFGFEDFTFEQTGERCGVLRFARGAQIKEFPISIPGFVDCGVWQEGMDYEKGDGCTWDGNYWLARRATRAKPGGEGDDTAASNDWRLAVRKGRKGKDGAAGRDLRSVTAKMTS